ncbi:hypothetical protein KUCAC02_034969, partial [Chaenocephalus aceratus]
KQEVMKGRGVPAAYQEPALVRPHSQQRLRGDPLTPTSCSSSHLSALTLISAELLAPPLALLRLFKELSEPPPG